MNKLNLKYGEIVRIKNTGSELDGLEVRVAGMVSRYIQDTYILEFLEDATRFDGEGEQYSSFAMWEPCLERV